MLPITPPTDNLYKFIALFGLLIMGMGVINLTNQRKNLISEKIEIVRIENKVLDSIYIHATIPESFREQRHSHAGFKKIKDWEEDVIKVRELAIKSPALPNMLTRQIITELDIASEKLISIKQMKKLLVLTIGVGFGMMLLGFWLWYHKDQKWVDKRIRERGNEY